MKNNKYSYIKASGYKFIPGVLVLLFICLLTSCTTEFDLELEKNEPRLVVDGWITNLPGPYEVRLTKSSHNYKSIGYHYLYAKTEAVKHALVIISDNTGVVDTLKPKLPEIEGIYKSDTFYVDHTNINDGFYETTKITGVPGRTYTLFIKVQEKEYTASAYMPTVPPIESVAYIIKEDPFKNNETLTVPTITFHEPKNSDDFYLLGLGEVSERWNPARRGDSRTWGVSALSDKLLPPYVKDFPVDDGVSPSGMDFYSPGDDFSVNMASLTMEAYDYFRVLIAQFYNDGGAYQPAPASPPTNISNGGLGFFGASAVSVKKGYVD